MKKKSKVKWEYCVKRSLFKISISNGIWCLGYGHGNGGYNGHGHDHHYNDYHGSYYNHGKKIITKNRIDSLTYPPKPYKSHSEHYFHNTIIIWLRKILEKVKYIENKWS